MEIMRLIEKGQERNVIDAELISSIDEVEEAITGAINHEVYFSVGSHDYSIAFVESEQCFGGESSYRILQDGWDCVYSIHSTVPGLAKCSYEDGYDVDYEIRHAPMEYLHDFAENLPRIIETLHALEEEGIIRLRSVINKLNCSYPKAV